MTRGITLTIELARASAQDAGNAHMRKHGRKAWSADDWNVSCDTLYRLMKHLPAPYPEIARQMEAA